MLAQSFLSHDVLGITEAERDALVKVLGMLERGELSHEEWPTKPNGFHMNIPGFQHECGTVACIRGWARNVHAEAFLGEFIALKYTNDALFTLFCPPDGIERHRLGPEHAAIALRSYLSSRESNWAEALA